MFACVQSDVLLASNSVEPGRPARVPWNVPVCGATTVISKDPADLKKTSLVEGTTPTTDGSSVGAKGARATTSHGGGGWLGEGDGVGGQGDGGSGLADGGGGEGDGGGGLGDGDSGDGDGGGGLGDGDSGDGDGGDGGGNGDSDGGGGDGDGGGGDGDGGDGDGDGDGGGRVGGHGASEGGGGDKGGDSLQTAGSSSTRAPVSSTIPCTRIALDGSVAISCSVAKLTEFPKPHANTVAPSPLTSAAASTVVSNSVLPGAASTVCSPSETSSTTLVAPTRASSAKSCRAASKLSEIEVLPSADIWSIPLLISAALYDHGTRIVAFAAKDTTAKRVASTPREYWATSFLAKAFSPSGPSIEPLGLGFFIEPLSSSTRTKSISVAQVGLSGLGGGLGEGGGGVGGDEGGVIPTNL
jgi:hypothetical protein